MSEQLYRPLGPQTLGAYLAGLPAIAARLGGEPGSWSMREVSDGNLNSVFLVEGPDGGVCVKQSLPHVRVDPSWRMPLDRTVYEAAWLEEVRPHVGALVPEPIHFDRDQFCLIIERLHPHVTLRDALIAGTQIPGLAATVARFVALTAFHTSILGEPFEPVMRRIARFAGNTTLTRITVDLVLTDPFEPNVRNRIPDGLAGDAAALAADPDLRRAATGLKRRFLGAPQALLHGDLHTGSLMVAPSTGDIRVIDGEFALMGPIGFDLGLFLANLLLNRIAHDGGDAETHRDWLLEEADRFFPLFAGHLRALCAGGTAGEFLHFAGTPHAATGENVEELIAEIERDMIGFAGVEMIRRTIGYAHVADLDGIDDAARATRCRREALRIGRMLATTSRPVPIRSLIGASRAS